MSTITHFLPDVDLRCSHDGLRALLKKLKIKVGPNDYVVFMNAHRTMLKMFCKGEDALLHYKKDGRVIDPGVVPFLAKFCDGKKLDMDGAVKEHLDEMLARRRRS